MILKPYKKDKNQLEQLQRLLREEADPKMRKIIEQDMKICRKGSTGEYQVALNIDRAYGSSDSIGILHDVRIPDGTGEGRYTQIDTVIINGPMRRAWAVEVKNWGGLIGIDEHEQWWREYRNGERALVKSPETQAKYCAEALKRWFDKNNWPIREVIPCIGFAAEVVLDDSIRKKCHQVFKADLFKRWHDVEEGEYSLWTLISRIRENRKTPIGPKQLKQLASDIMEDHRPLSFDHSSKYGIISDNNKNQIDSEQYHYRIEVIQDVFLIHAKSKKAYALKIDIDKILCDKPNAKQEIRKILGTRAQYNDDHKNWIIPEEEGLRVTEELRAFLQKKVEAE